ncbi:hypothetical protein HAX54_036814 [Datura stramonium]|uniref:Uncharacterized protein n=1 Tax=Datura stramonium TaxID=4076 RepID=A0ABS8RMG4_DATST|nr:hypothetical protein [Datura stramonium]
MNSQFTAVIKVLSMSKPKSMRILLNISTKDPTILSFWMIFFQQICHQVHYSKDQVNTFNCEGLVMGINISHILADGFTLGTFVKEWAHISQTGTTKDCLSSFGGLWSLFPTRVQSGSLFSAPSNRDPSIVTKSDSKAKTEPVECHIHETYSVEVASLMEGSCGNFISQTWTFKGIFFIEVPQDIAATIGKASIDDITSVRAGHRSYFGWGKPSWVSSVSKNYEGISLIDTKSEDGIEAWIGLKEKDMAEFERDPDILSTSKPFPLHVHGLPSDPSTLRVCATDFHSNTWDALKSAQELEDMRDRTGIGGSWSDFIDYLIAALKSEDVKLVMDGQSKLEGAAHAKLVAQAEGYRAYLFSNNDAVSCQMFYQKKRKRMKLQKQLSAVLYSKRQKMQKITENTASDTATIGSSLESPVKQAAQLPSAKVSNRVVPAHRRARVRGVLLHDTEDERQD